MLTSEISLYNIGGKHMYMFCTHKCCEFLPQCRRCESLPFTLTEAFRAIAVSYREDESSIIELYKLYTYLIQFILKAVRCYRFDLI